MAFYDLPSRQKAGMACLTNCRCRPAPLKLALAHGQIGILSSGHKTKVKYINSDQQPVNDHSLIDMPGRVSVNL